MLRDDLPGANLRRLGHGDLVVEPRCHDHAGRQIFKLSHGAGNQVPYAVHQPDAELCSTGQFDMGGLLGYEFRLGSHDGAARAALWQLVGGSIPAKAIFHPGQHLGLHETLDKGRLAGAHRPHYADIDVAVRSLGYALINVRDLTYHFQPFLSPANGKAVIVVCSTV